jgi:hypothetical protein
MSAKRTPLHEPLQTGITMLLKTLSGSRRAHIARNAIIIAGLLATVFIRPESDFYSGLVAGVRFGLMIIVLIRFRRMPPA